MSRMWAATARHMGAGERAAACLGLAALWRKHVKNPELGHVADELEWEGRGAAPTLKSDVVVGTARDTIETEDEGRLLEDSRFKRIVDGFLLGA